MNQILKNTHKTNKGWNIYNVWSDTVENHFKYVFKMHHVKSNEYLENWVITCSLAEDFEEDESDVQSGLDNDEGQRLNASTTQENKSDSDYEFGDIEDEKRTVKDVSLKHPPKKRKIKVSISWILQIHPLLWGYD